MGFRGKRLAWTQQRKRPFIYRFDWGLLRQKLSFTEWEFIEPQLASCGQSVVDLESSGRATTNVTPVQIIKILLPLKRYTHSLAHPLCLPSILLFAGRAHLSYHSQPSLNYHSSDGESWEARGLTLSGLVRGGRGLGDELTERDLCWVFIWIGCSDVCLWCTVSDGWCRKIEWCSPLWKGFCYNLSDRKVILLRPCLLWAITDRWF